MGRDARGALHPGPELQGDLTRETLHQGPGQAEGTVAAKAGTWGQLEQLRRTKGKITQWGK